MGWWRSFADAVTGNVIPNPLGPEDLNPGDPDGFEYIPATPTENRSLPIPWSSPWDGWPSDWDTPTWQQTETSISKLVDVAWACLDLNSNIVSAMPVYRLRDGRIIEPKVWMNNPDPGVYNCWQEFAKQLFWDYQMGEAFVLAQVNGSDGYPASFRVIPPWFVNVEWVNGMREYKIGTLNVTDRILHIRYHSTTADARGHGPLEVAGARQTNIRLLQRYVNQLAETGGVPLYWMELQRRIDESEGQDLIARWIETRAKNAGHPALVAGGATLHQAQSMNAQDMALMEISQFSESRIAVLLGVPPALIGLAGASGSLTYSNISDLFDFHDRSSLRPKSKMLMESLSAWALPRGQAAELNRDDYTRLPFDQRVMAYQTLYNIVDPATGQRGITIEQIHTMERFHGEAAAEALTGGDI